jgi:hypothetical protein
MVLGGTAAKSTTSPAPSPAIEIPQPELAASTTGSVAQGTSGAAVLKSKEFWDDLEGFLLQRVRDEGEAAKLAKLFKSSWEKS